MGEADTVTQPADLSLKALHDFWADMGVADVDAAAVMPAPSGGVVIPAHAPISTAPVSPGGSSGPRPAPRRLAGNPVSEARRAAAVVETLDDLKRAIERFEGCALKPAARTTVVCDGVYDAEVMFIGEAPGAEEDAIGLPFVGRAGKLLDRMLATVGFSRAQNVYITNTIFWRPPGNRDPSPEELDICAPFLTRQIELKKPKLIVTLGKFATQAMLGTDDGIMRLRGRRMRLKREGLPEPLPCLPFLHPAYLLRRPADKAKAWSDLLQLAAIADELGVKRGRGI